jgi:hypothetical protein
MGARARLATQIYEVNEDKWDTSAKMWLMMPIHHQNRDWRSRELTCLPPLQIDTQVYPFAGLGLPETESSGVGLWNDHLCKQKTTFTMARKLILQR